MKAPVAVVFGPGAAAWLASHGSQPFFHGWTLLGCEDSFASREIDAIFLTTGTRLSDARRQFGGYTELSQQPVFVPVDGFSPAECIAAFESALIGRALSVFDELGGATFVIEMIELLNKQTPEQFIVIEGALDQDDLATAQRQAHSMKSTFGNFGARRCRQLAITMDSAGKDGNAAEFRTAYEQLKPEFRRLQSILADLLAD